MNKTEVRYNNVFSLASGNPSLFKERDLVRSSFLSFAELNERIKILYVLFFIFFIQSHSNNSNFIA